LNGAKRVLSVSKYGRIASWCILFLITLFNIFVQQVVDVCITHKVLELSSLQYNLLRWGVCPLLSFTYAGAIVWTTYINYKIRKHDNVKYDKNDI
jgi:hypothetical protein